MPGDRVVEAERVPDRQDLVARRAIAEPKRAAWAAGVDVRRRSSASTSNFAGNLRPSPSVTSNSLAP
jgi:hypothetical protein